MTSGNDKLLAALAYADRGWSVIPVGQDKRPLLKWAEFQGRRASPEEIREWFNRWPGANVGIVTGAISNLAAIDCDTGEAIEAVESLLPDTLETPIAETPRGGRHYYFEHSEDLHTVAGARPGVDIRAAGGYIIAPPSCNGAGKAWTWTVAPEGVEPAPVPHSLIKNIFIYRRQQGSQLESTIVNKTNIYFTEGRRDDDLFHAVNALVKAGCELSFIQQVAGMLANSSTPPFPENEVSLKIDSALKRAERRDRNIAAEVREWVLSTDGNFESTIVNKELQLSTRPEMQAAHMALKRLCEEPEPLIERFGPRRGAYRRIDTSIEYMDFVSADPNSSVDLLLPLGLHNKTRFFPKAAITVAGVSGHGKTAFVLNAASLNFGRFPIFYFNSEISEQALNLKLSKFPQDIHEWNRNMKVIMNWDFHNVADKIQPDAFNIVDYLEPQGDRAFDIHSVITAIIRRLRSGVALIAIQKKQDSKLGTGGIYSIKAASLALALDWGKLEITKNRFREEDPFPSRSKINFEIHRGHEFVKVGNWFA